MDVLQRKSLPVHFKRAHNLLPGVFGRDAKFALSPATFSTSLIFRDSLAIQQSGPEKFVGSGAILVYLDLVFMETC
jgi:hypothetical protein